VELKTALKNRAATPTSFKKIKNFSVAKRENEK
jgi:hypothetical protein